MITIYKIKFIDSDRLMQIKSLDHVDKLSGIYKKNANHIWKEKKSNWNAILLGLKIIDYIKNVRNPEENPRSQ